jgi:P27 family predicted phage terminase small subunit
MPAFIEVDPLAASRWRTLAPRIAQAGVLTEAHGEMLALLCSTWADLERAREQFAAMGYQQLVVDETVGPNGERRRKVKPNPLVVRIEKQAYQVARFLGEFGLTPMTSAKVNAEKAVEGVDPFAEFLSSDPYEVQ